MKKIVVMASVICLMLSCDNNTKKEEMNKTTAREAFEKNIKINGAVGELDAVLQVPRLKNNEKCTLVILMHGIFSNKEFPLIKELADSLKQQGYATLRFDFNGHGKSEGKFVNMTVPLEVEDAEAVYNYANDLDYFDAIDLVGHSQGGAVASLLAGKLNSGIHKLVLYAPAAVLEDQSKAGNMMGVSFDPDNVPDSIRVYNHNVGKEYVLTAQQSNIYERAAGYKGAACIIQGLSDEVVPSTYAEKYHDIYNNSELHLLEGENHVFQKDVTEAVKIGLKYITE